jgi:hypothetical protein
MVQKQITSSNINNIPLKNGISNQKDLKMNKKLIFSAMYAIATLSTATNVLAQPQYVAATGASGCADCHLNSFGQGYKPEVITIATTAASYADKMARLTTFVKSLTAAVVDTAPVLHPINTKWNITVGEVPLAIPFVVSDAENDTFAIHGSVATGMTVSAITTDPVSQLPTFNLKWTPTAVQAGKSYPVSVYVKETGTGRVLLSKTVKTNVTVWPARANAATAKVSQNNVQLAQWQNNVLKIAGQITFKSTATAAQRATALATLRMTVKSKSGMVIGLPLVLKPNATGNWSKLLTLTASQVPCTVVVDYEGLKAERGVSLAPVATCLK